MKSFQYAIQDEMGLHARPAGLLIKEIQPYDSKVTISANGKKVDARKLFAVMGLAVKKGTVVTFYVEGPDEEKESEKLESFLKQNL